MKTNKVVVTIKMQSLSIDVLAGMLAQVNEQVMGGAESGMLQMDDGDLIEWETTRKAVEI